MPSLSPWLDQEVLGCEGWTEMQQALEVDKYATWQQILAEHTSTCCKPKRQVAQTSSVDEAGLRTPLTDPGNGDVWVRFHLGIRLQLAVG